MVDIVRELTREAEATRILLLNLRDVLVGDDEATEDAIEGETSFKEAAAGAVARLADIEALCEAIKTQRDNLTARAQRLSAQSESIKAALVSALAQADLTKLELPQATVSRRPVPPKSVITSEADLPAQFWKRSDPTIDRAAVLAALKRGEPVPGAELSNGGETLQLRFK